MSQNDRYNEQNVVHDLFHDHASIIKLFPLLKPIYKTLIIESANIAFIQGQQEGLREATDMIRRSTESVFSRVQSRPGDGDMGG